MIDDINIEYRNINDFIQWKLIEKCDRGRISIDEVSPVGTPFLKTNHVIYQSQDMLLIGFRVSYVLLREA